MGPVALQFLRGLPPLFGLIDVGLVFHGCAVTATADENECDKADDNAGLCPI